MVRTAAIDDLEAIEGIYRAARAFMKEAEEAAAKHASEVNAQTRQQCDALRSQAEGRLAEAAESIVRRVVKS